MPDPKEQIMKIYKSIAKDLDKSVEEVKQMITPTKVKYMSYKKDCEKFINKQVKIEDKDSPGTVIDFKLWDDQKPALKIMEEEDRVIVLKARQLGLSWLALAYITWFLLFHSGKSASSISQTEGDSKELVRRVGFILKHLPDWLIVSEKADEEVKAKNKTGITYIKHSLRIEIHHPKAEDSIFKGKTSSPDAARSFTDNIVLLDEWAFHSDARGIWRAAYPTINRPGGGQIIGISTGEKGTFFEEKWQNAKWEYGGEKGAGFNTFTGIFLPWDADPRRDEKWYEETKKEMNNFRSEYPSTPSEAFTTGQGMFFTEYNRDHHVVYDKNWYPPLNWRIVLAYDGGYNKAAAVWYAISNDGWAIAYREYYPSYKTDPEQMEDIRELSFDPDGNPEIIDYIVADTSCWAKSQDTGKSTVEIGEEHGLRPWRQADKNRIMGWKRLHEWLTPIRDETGEFIKDRYGNILCKLRFTESCSNTIRIFPGLKANENKPDDLESGQEDHLHDCHRYFVMSRPKAPISKYEKKKRKNKRRKQTKPRSNVVGY